MNTSTKKIILSALVILLSACAHHQNGYGSYSGNDPYSSNGYYPEPNYPNSNYPGYGGFQSYPSYPGYRNYPSYPGSQYPGRGYRGPYNVPQSNNYYYNNNNYNRYQPQPRQPSYQNPRYGYQGDRHHDDDDDHRRSNWDGWQHQNSQQARPKPGYGYNQNRPHSPQADSVIRPHVEWPRNQSNGMMQRPNQGGGWQGQGRQQPHVGHNDEHSNFGTISEQMGQKPVQQGHHGQNNHKKHGQQFD